MGAYTQEKDGEWNSYSLTSCDSEDEDEMSEENLERRKEELAEITGSFRDLKEGLITFLQENGKITETRDKDSGELEAEKYLKAACKKHGLKYPRDLMKKASITRKSQLNLAMAMELSRQEADDFFKRICLDHPLYSRDISDLACGFVLDNDLSLEEEKDFLTDVNNWKKNHQTQTRLQSREHPAEFSFSTAELETEALELEDPEMFWDFVERYEDELDPVHSSARTIMRSLWDEAVTMAREENEQYSIIDSELMEKLKEDAGDTRRAYQVLVQIVGLSYREMDKQVKTFRSDLEKPYIHRFVRENFLDKNKIHKLIYGEAMTSESLRKGIILLYFYIYWLKWRKNQTLKSEDNRHEYFFSQLNKRLDTANLAPLYAGHPYDWLFMNFSLEDDPLESLRIFFRSLHS